MLAITLARKNFRENDQRIVFYAKDQGKIEAVARGVKKIVSKNAPALEPFALLDIEVVPGKNFLYVTKAQVIENFLGVRENLNNLIFAGFAIDLIQKIIKTGEYDQNIFKLVYSFEKYLGESVCESSFIAAAFAGRIACFLGFTPIFGSCVFCKTKLFKSEFFSISGGGTVCVKCAQIKKEETTKIPAICLKKFRSILTENWSRISDEEMSQNDIDLTLRIVENYLTYHLGLKIKIPETV